MLYILILLVRKKEGKKERKKERRKEGKKERKKERKEENVSLLTEIFPKSP